MDPDFGPQHESGSTDPSADEPRLQHGGWHTLPSGQSPSRRNRAWSSVLDGKHVWGSIDVEPPRQGFRSYRLVVYPPGIDAVERRYLRVSRTWPIWGTALFLTSLIVLGSQLGPWLGLAISAAVWLGAVAVSCAWAGRARSLVRTLSVDLIDRHFDPLSAQKYKKLETLVGLLSQADDLREQGQLSAIDHEVVWWRVYDSLAPEPQRVDQP